MKKQILISLILVSSVLTINAQTWIGSLDINGNLWRNGNIGIGTTNPWTTSKLEVHGITSIGQFTNGTAVIDAFNSYAYFGCNTATNGIAIGPSGNVGIGTTNFDGRLCVVGSSAGNEVKMQLANTSASGFSVIRFSDSETGNGKAWLHRFNASWSSPVAMWEANSIGFYESIGSMNIGGKNAFKIFTGSADTEKLRIDELGNVGIGTTSPSYKLDVCGTIRAKEVKVDLLGGCDFVFKPDYKLMDLKTLEQFVKTNQHLPEIASEKEMVDNGINMKEMQMKLLQKMEEMTLYMIEQNKMILALKEKIEKLETASK